MRDHEAEETPFERASERLSDARDAAADRVADARASAAETFADARASAGQTFADAKAAAGEMAAKVKPRLRGVSHQWAFFVSLVLGAGLIVAADTPEATWAIAVYAFSLSALFGVSALYHRVTWTRPEVRRWIRRLDHSMIFVVIAGTNTPLALIALRGALAGALLIAVCAGAAAGVVLTLAWIDAPEWRIAPLGRLRPRRGWRASGRASAPRPR